MIKAMVFPVVMYGCESWTIKKAERQRIDAFELWCWRRLLKVPWTARRSNQNPKGNQSWIFIGRTDAEAETEIHWPPDAKNWLLGKDLDAGKDWRQEEKGMTEDEMVGWHHWLDGHEFEQALGAGDGQGSLACCSLWGHKGLDMTERLNWTELNWIGRYCCLGSDSREKNASYGNWLLAPNTLFHIKEIIKNVRIIGYLFNALFKDNKCRQPRIWTWCRQED